MSEPSDKKKQSPSDSSSGYLKYSGLAVQLLAAIGFFGWLGYLLDHYLSFQFPVFMLLFGFTAFGGMMFQVYRSINK
jgi:F0F1-type ATP synthase assembly protein I